MEKKLNISPRSFWDADFNDVINNSDKYYRFIICRIFDYGKDSDIEALKEYYGYDTIKEVLTTEEFLTLRSFPRAMDFLNLPTEAFRYNTSKKWGLPIKHAEKIK
jgi:hypothetical protein